MHRFAEMSPRERLVYHVQALERLEEVKQAAADDMTLGFDLAKGDGYDTATLKVVLKLRKMTYEQRRERRVLEAIYLAALGMLEGDPLSDSARRRLDGEPQQEPEAKGPSQPDNPDAEQPSRPETKPPEQAPLILKDPKEARQEGATAAAAGKRVYDNPYSAGDPCRAAWDEGWCAQQKSHGMETPAAYQRRTAKPPDKDDKGTDTGDSEQGAA